MSVSEGIHRIHDAEPRLQRSPWVELLPRAKNGRMAPQRRHIFVVMGPAGCGKSTVARVLAESLGLPYVEGDEVNNQKKSKDDEYTSQLRQ